jgi:hypothetical protein
MSKYPIAAVLWIAVQALVSPPAMGFKSESSPETASGVEQILRREADASRESLNRRELLKELLEEDPESAAARWQAGYVRDAGEWKPFESVQTEPQNPALKEYREIRQTAAQSVDDQLRLANWCKKNGLVRQERAHLTAALAFAGDRDVPQIRARLGQRLVDGRWVTREEARDLERFVRETMQSTKLWGPRMQSIAERLGGSRRQRESAAAELARIDDPAALLAAELVLTGRNEAAALKAVELFSRFDQYRASQALARQAVFSSWPSVRTAATQALKGRKQDEFVPLLLREMAQPAESRVEILYGPGGRLRCTHICSREMADRWEMARYDLTIFTVRIEVEHAPYSPPWLQFPFEKLNTARSQNDTRRLVQDSLYGRQATLARHNEHIEKFNARIGKLLADTTGESFASSPQVWWARWIDEIDVEPAEKKRVVIIDEEQRLIHLPRFVPAPSCFAAGTPVWTDRGAVPVEQIQVGDCVLAKDDETGELAYKPVVLTTRREAPRLVRLTVGGETFEMTRGHPAWVSGSGWMRARDLTSGQSLHTVTGAVSVGSVEPLGPGTVYNLVVADFHTYFFGDSQILSHDTTIPKLTDVVVPGLPVAESAQP